jgi:glutaminyl-peptide cyclotransferase
MGSTFDGQRAWEDIDRFCALGPRMCGSKELGLLREMIAQRIHDLGGEIRLERFSVEPPSLQGDRQEGINLIASLGPRDGERLLLATHFDTRPRAEEETLLERQQMPILGANDGASGVAVLLEIGRLLSRSAPTIGVDLAFFDAEEYVFDPETDPLVLGSIHFASQISKPEVYQAAVVVDIVGRSGQILSPDIDSWYLSRSLVQELWDVADRLAESMQATWFDREVRYEVLDDHIPLLSVGIPSLCLIDVDDPRWHTLDDRPEHCHPQALAEVGQVLWEWLLVRMRARAGSGSGSPTS